MDNLPGPEHPVSLCLQRVFLSKLRKIVETKCQQKSARNAVSIAGTTGEICAQVAGKLARQAKRLVALSSISQYFMLLHRLDAKIDLRTMKRKRSKLKNPLGKIDQCP
jgi:hypothetical protein